MNLDTHRVSKMDVLLVLENWRVKTILSTLWDGIFSIFGINKKSDYSQVFDNFHQVEVIWNIGMLLFHVKTNFWSARMLTTTLKLKLVITLPAMVLRSNWMFLTKLKLMANVNSQLVKMELQMTFSVLLIRILLVKTRWFYAITNLFSGASQYS